MKRLSIYIMALVALLFAVPQAEARLATGVFPANSLLAQGRWVQMEVRGTGIYEISYDKLRELGFTDPATVRVYGRGGEQQPYNFADNDGNPEYKSDLSAASVWHNGDKLYFFGQGPAKLRANAGAQPVMTRESMNAYTWTGTYYLTDSAQGQLVYNAVDNFRPSTLAPYTSATSCFYHERELGNYVNSGREFFGENFTAAADRHQLIPYSLPGVAAQTPVEITCHMAVNSSSADNLTVGFQGASETGKFAFDPVSSLLYYTYTSSTPLSLPLPSAEGNLDLSLSTAGTISYAALDYILMSAPRTLAFQQGESQFTVYPYDYNATTAGNIALAGAPTDTQAWAITDSGNVLRLPSYVDGADVKFDGLNNNFAGQLTFFSPSQTQLQPENYTPVANQNLHALTAGPTPDMIIITLPEFKDAADALAEIHRQVNNANVQVFLSDDVIREFSAGTPDPMAYRALAKMFYDKDFNSPRKFRHMLLLGPAVRDHRNIYGIVPGTGTLLSNQSPSAQNGDDTWCVLDWYGMLEDYSANHLGTDNLFKCQQQVAVGIIPARNATEAQNYVDKIAHAYADDSYAYWLNSYNFLTDGGDNNEHMNLGNNLWIDSQAFSNRATEGRKIYNNLYELKGTKHAFIDYLKQGSFFSVYLGHADPSELNSETWNMGDEQMLTNKRYGFMNFAACTTAPFDNSQRGVAEALIMTPGKGLLGGVTTSRSGWSNYNQQLMDFFMRAMAIEDINKTSAATRTPVRSKRTVGDLYIMAKNKQYDKNKYAYNLMCDPLFQLPYATHDVKANLNNSVATSDNPAVVYPHSSVPLSGSIMSRTGAPMANFNGQVVAKVYAPSITRKTSTRCGSPSVNMEIDEMPLLVTSLPVVNGQFSGSIMIPAALPADADNLAVVRLAAYDPTTRVAASSAAFMRVADYDETHAVQQDNAPTISDMYADGYGLLSTDLLPSAFTLHADITDDYGICTTTVNGISGLNMNIDGNVAINDITSYLTISDAGRAVHVAYPVVGMSDGTHTITLTATDAAGQVVTHTMTVNVGNNAAAEALALVRPGVCRQNAAMTITDGGAQSRELLVHDAQGRLVFNTAVSGTDYTWALTNNAGVRVPDGIYTASLRSCQNGRPAAVSAPLEIVVL